MNDDVLAMTQELTSVSGDFIATHERSVPAIPAYLEDTYWWAYLRPRSIWLFEREWLVNLILWGNMHRLTDAVLDEMDCKAHSAVLQVACVYGDFSNRVAGHLQNSGSRLHILDIAPIQLRNVGDKLKHHDNVSLHHQDSSKLQFTTGKFDQTVVFFLLHEQPQEVRRKTIAEAIRVTRPGGKVVFVDYHGPQRTNPLRYLMHPVLHWLEPFALDLWRTKLQHYLPERIAPDRVSSTFYFGGLYQKVVVSC
jgi:ubiquinone/menaquinone biosynthesis C-methylase UbiE